MNRFFISLGLIVSVISPTITFAQPSLHYRGYLPFSMPEVVVPTFKTDTFNIVSYGAVADGIVLNTKAFKAAINACVKAGGGVVLVPKGLWLTGPIELKSNINLHTEKGALVQFSRNFNDYPLVQTSFEGKSEVRCLSPITADSLENIAITGQGVFDGSGDVWRPVKKGKVTPGEWNKLVKSGGVVNKKGDSWYPSEKSLLGNTKRDSLRKVYKTVEDYNAIRDALRPALVNIEYCKNILLDGPVFQNSPGWNVHPLACQHITVLNVTILNDWNAQNGDGIDFESCRYGYMNNCIISVGDDGICIKSGRDKEGRERGLPTEDFVITNCYVYRCHGGFVIGSEMSGGVRNLYVSNCTFMGSDVGMRFKTKRGRGGVVEKIYVENINMVNIPTTAISFNMYYGGNAPTEGEEDSDTGAKASDTIPSVNETTPLFKDIYIRNIVCNGAQQAMLIRGLPELSIKNINLENVTIHSVKGAEIIDADAIKLKNVTIISEHHGPVVIISNATNVTCDGIRYQRNADLVLKLSGKNSANIRVINTDFSKAKKDVEVAKDVNASALIR